MRLVLKGLKYLSLVGGAFFALLVSTNVSAQIYADTPHKSLFAKEGDIQDLDLNFDFGSLDELQELLPKHLRSPLPLASDVVAPAPSVRPDFDLITPSQAQKGDVSRIEEFYRQATADRHLRQHGYDAFQGAVDRRAVPAGLVQDSYILGAGDRLNIAFMGERKDRGVYRITSQGTLVIDHLPQIAASGKTLEALRTDISHLLDAQGYHGEVIITLEGIRQLSVLVVGQVAKPGRHHISALHTALEAIEAAGGIEKTGSLRQVRLFRAGKSTTIDLYPILGLRGSNQALPTLQDGDRIIVPPLGATVAITGDVRQPGIYELPARGGLSATQGLELAGGVLSFGNNRITMHSPRSDGKRMMQEIADSSDEALRDGVVISVKRGADLPDGVVTLMGEVRSPGAYPFTSYKKLSQLLSNMQVFGDDVYPLMGVISRRQTGKLARKLVAFSPQDVFLKRADSNLQVGDQIYLLSRKDVMKVMAHEDGHEIDPLIAGFVREYGVSVQGAVRLSGTWPVAQPTPIQTVLDVAGGVTADGDVMRTEILRNDVGLLKQASYGADSGADRSTVARRDRVNLTEASAQSLTLAAGDSVRVPDRFEAVTRQSVTLAGEVRSPGTYDLMRGDTLLSVIERAGGLTDQAYPLGAVFSRAAERRREKEKYAAAAHDLERSIALAAKGDDGKVDMAQMAIAKELVNELKTIEPAGRITVQADPAILRQDPAQDILLESGDRVYFPKRPLSVRVTGEVLSPAALQFRADKNPRDYITEAGGTTHHADRGRIFVLFPDGSAQPLSASTWTTMRPVMIIPGSTIVVPRDPKPFDFIESAKDITQILSNLAITGIYADDLARRR